LPRLWSRRGRIRGHNSQQLASRASLQKSFSAKNPKMSGKQKLPLKTHHPKAGGKPHLYR
jgi:hypothetical protein